MNVVSTRRVGLGIAGALAGSARDAGEAGAHAAAAGWRTPLAAPVRRPVRALAEAAERRGARDESLLLAAAARTFSQAARGPLLDHVVHALIEARLLERITAQALEGEALERVLGIAAERRAATRAADAVLADEGVERLLAHVADQPAVDGLIERVLVSRLAQSATDQVLASEELRRVVAHVAQSEEVRDAPHAQTHGLVDEAGDQLRDRTATVDDRMEGVARRLLRRHPRGAPLAGFDEDPAPA
jgi:hypothetical protein